MEDIKDIVMDNMKEFESLITEVQLMDNMVDKFTDDFLFWFTPHIKVTDSQIEQLNLLKKLKPFFFKGLPAQLKSFKVVEREETEGIFKIKKVINRYVTDVVIFGVNKENNFREITGKEAINWLYVLFSGSNFEITLGNTKVIYEVLKSYNMDFKDVNKSYQNPFKKKKICKSKK